MGQIKKFDKLGFQSRIEGGYFDIRYWQNFVYADKMLVEIDGIIAESGIEGVSPIGYVSRANKIDQLCKDACVLINYPNELEEELISVDTLFSSNVHDEALNDLATIKIDDIRIRNSFDVTVTQRYEHIGYEDPSETYLKEYLTLSDFVGSFDGLKSQETSYVKGFTDLLYSPYMTEGKDLHEIVAEKNDEIYEILYGAEFDVKRHQPGKEALSEIFGLVTIGLFSLAKAYMGYDPITGEILTEEERTALAISGSVTAALFIFTMGTSGGAGEALVTYMSIAGGGSAYILTATACEEMGASQLETFLFSSLAGILVGYSIAKAGNSCLEFYRNNRQQVLEHNAILRETDGAIDNVSVQHAVGSASQAQSVLDGIDPHYFNKNSRFGGGFYVGADSDTIVAELAEHGNTAQYAISFDMNLSGQRVLDLTDRSIASEWNYVHSLTSIESCREIGELARNQGYSVIIYQSYRGEGINYVVFNNFDEILSPRIVTPIN